MFQVLKLPQLCRRLCLMASPVPPITSNSVIYIILCVTSRCQHYGMRWPEATEHCGRSSIVGLVASISLTDKNIQDILSMHPDLFKHGLGCCTTAKASLILRDDAQLKYCKSRKLPFAIKPVVDAELDRL